MYEQEKQLANIQVALFCNIDDKDPDIIEGPANHQKAFDFMVKVAEQYVADKIKPENLKTHIAQERVQMRIPARVPACISKIVKKETAPKVQFKSTTEPITTPTLKTEPVVEPEKLKPESETEPVVEPEKLKTEPVVEPIGRNAEDVADDAKLAPLTPLL